MNKHSQTVGKLLVQKSNVTTMVGTFVSYSATGFVVDCGGGRVPANPGSGYLPLVGETVWVWFIDGIPFVMGPTVPRPATGTVVSASSGLVTLTTAVGNVTVPYASTMTPTAGQVMQLLWQGGGFGVAVMSAAQVAPPAPGAPSTGAVAHVNTFTALDAGSFQSSRWWTPLVYASDNNVGAWFYGSKISDTIPATATAMSIQIYISPQQIYGNPPNFALHASPSKPGGAPSFSGTTAVGIASGWVTLPASFATALKSGGGSFGVGVVHGGYQIFRSIAQDAQSGALRITATY